MYTFLQANSLFENRIRWYDFFQEKILFYTFTRVHMEQYRKR
jgi:hypothetical protein